MLAHTATRRFAVALLALSALAAPLQGASLAVADAEAVLHHAYYLEHSEKSYADAKTLYKKIQRLKPSAKVSQAAAAGLARCRDRLAAEDFAQLMPPESLVYVELKRPGEIVEKLAKMLGLASCDIHDALNDRPNANANIETPFHLPNHITISPAVFEALGCFGGAAASITAFSPDGGEPSDGVLVIHHGDFTLLKGVIETAFQFAPLSEKIAGMPTFSAVVPDFGEVRGVLTESLLIVGTDREIVADVIDRLTGDANESLATREDLSDVFADRSQAMAFLYVDLQGVLNNVKADLDEDDINEFAMMNALADIDSLRYAAFSINLDEHVLGAQFTLRLADDHHSLAYNLLRLPPMSRTCLSCVPPNAAAIAGLGLNPAMTNIAIEAVGKEKDISAVTGFDIGREFFGNIRELCAFVIPGELDTANRGHMRSLPNVGVLLSVNNIDKSRMLWDQLLQLPVLIGEGRPSKPEHTRINGTDVVAYEIPDLGRLYVSEFNNCLAIGLTRDAIEAAIVTHHAGKSILDDEMMSRVIARMPKDSSVMLAGHVGRLCDVVASSCSGPRHGVNFGFPTLLCRDTVAWIGLGQSPSQLTLSAAVSGLPDLNEAVQKFAPAIRAAAGVTNKPAGALRSSRNAARNTQDAIDFTLIERAPE